MYFHEYKKSVLLIIALLAGITVILCIAFVSTYKKLAPERVINSERVSKLIKQHEVLGPNDISSISSWMTFDYINHVFALPQDYIKSALTLNDPRYPELTLSRYAKDSSMDESAVVSEVKDAVANYFKTLPLQ